MLYDSLFGFFQALGFPALAKTIEEVCQENEGGGDDKKDKKV